MQAVIRPARCIALGSGWLALIIVTGAAVAAPRTAPQVAAGNASPQLGRGSDSTVVQEARPVPADGVSCALEQRTMTVGRASAGTSTGREDDVFRRVIHVRAAGGTERVAGYAPTRTKTVRVRHETPLVQRHANERWHPGVLLNAPR
jgi:hypothetical protein